MTNDRITRLSDNHSRIFSSNDNSIYCSSNANNYFKINKEGNKYKDAKIEITSIKASKITQTKEDRDKENTKGKED